MKEREGMGGSTVWPLVMEQSRTERRRKGGGGAAADMAEERMTEGFFAGQCFRQRALIDVG